MMKNFNWGHGITLFYVIFVGAVVTALVASFGVDHSLVVDDYYAQDLAYQQTYDKLTNSIASDNIEIKTDANNVTLLFGEAEAIKGSVYFYRASDKTQDFIKKIDSNKMVIPTSGIANGKWSLKIDWTVGAQSYYKEEVVYL